MLERWVVWRVVKGLMPANERFDLQGNRPQAWTASADALWSAASLIESAVVPMDTLMPAERGPEALLRGLAFECGFKALWLIRNPATLAKGGRYVKPAGVGEHDLLQLADAVLFQVSATERPVLNRLSAFVKFAGRYPIPRLAEQAEPVDVKGRPVIPQYFGLDDFALVATIWTRLRDQLGPAY